MDIKVLDRREIAQSCRSENIVSISSSYVAISSGSAVAVSSLDVAKKEMILLGHTDTVTQLHFSASNILLSCSADSLLSWNLDLARAAVNAGKKPLSVFVGVGLGAAAYISTTKNIILLAVKADVIILDTLAGSTRYLEGHESTVVFCEMLSSDRIISLSNDNNLKVWCLTEKRAIAQFKLLASAPFTSVYFNVDTLYLGAADGMLHVYEPLTGTRLKRLNIESYLPALDRSLTPDSDVIYAQPLKHYLTHGDTSPEEDEDSTVNNSVLAIFQITNKTDSKTDSLSTFTDVPPVDMQVENVLVVMLTSGIVQLNSLSLQLLTSTSFAHHTPTLPLAYTAQFFVKSGTSTVVYTNLFSTSLTLLLLRKLDSSTETDISMIQKCILTTTTPLLSISQWKKPEEKVPVVKATEKRKAKAKSSGYSSTQPRRDMFKPQTNKKPGKKEQVKKVPYVYPAVDCRPRVQKRRLIVSDRKSAVHALAYSRDSQQLVAGLADYSSMILKLPEGNKSTPLLGHTGPVACVRWNTTSEYVLTTAADKTCKVWDAETGDVAINLKYSDGNTKNCQKLEFKKDPVCGQFYYIDKFLILGHSRELNLYKYHIDKDAKSSKRVIGRYQNICTSQLPHSVTSLSAVNAFFSNLVVCGLSDKSLLVYDYNKQEEVMRITDVHTRAPHHLATIEGSKYVSHSCDTYNLLLSCSVMDDCKLWDVRSGQCVRCFGKQSSIRTSPSISTCVRYVAIPADDQAVYMFDIRNTSGELHKIQDSALTTQFSPKYPQLVVGSAEGMVTFYNDS